MEGVISYLVVALFILTYILIVFFYHKKTYFVWATSLIILLLGVLTPLEAIKAVYWNVIGIYVGMLFISEAFIYSKIPDFMAERFVHNAHRAWIALLGVCFLSGLISIAVENVAVVLIMAPIAFFIAERLRINPISLLIGIAVSSNLQGVATMIGDPPSLLLTSYAKLNFNDFFIFQGRPGLFFAVQIGAILSLFVLYFFFRKYHQKTEKILGARIRSHFPGFLLLLMIFLLAVTSFTPYIGSSPIMSFLNQYKAGFICLLTGLVAWIWYYDANRKDFKPMVKRLDWETGLFLVAIFILVESLVKVNFMETVASFIASLTGNNLFLAFNIILWSSVLFSGFVDNVPYIAAMLPVVGNLAVMMGVEPYLLLFGLVIGASVGGNITPVGASANIVAMGLLKKKGYKPNFWQFVKIGLPFTLVAVLASAGFIWLMFS
jgi:Na+/H+ antiporter NhaD/arsenite permease-like protein